MKEAREEGRECRGARQASWQVSCRPGRRTPPTPDGKTTLQLPSAQHSPMQRNAPWKGASAKSGNRCVSGESTSTRPVLVCMPSACGYLGKGRGLGGGGMWGWGWGWEMWGWGHFLASADILLQPGCRGRSLALVCTAHTAHPAARHPPARALPSAHSGPRPVRTRQRCRRGSRAAHTFSPPPGTTGWGAGRYAAA